MTVLSQWAWYFNPIAPQTKYYMEFPLLCSINCLKSCHAWMCFILRQLFLSPSRLIFLEITHGLSVFLWSSIMYVSLLSSLCVEMGFLTTTDCLFLSWLADISYYLDLTLFLPFIIAHVYLLFNFSSSFSWSSSSRNESIKCLLEVKIKVQAEIIFSPQVPLIRWLTKYRVLNQN